MREHKYHIRINTLTNKCAFAICRRASQRMKDIAYSSDLGFFKYLLCQVLGAHATAIVP